MGRTFFVGVVIVMVVQLLLGILGLAIGASIINPQQEANPMDGIGMGASIYWIISSIISLFAGGFAAGALVSVQYHPDRTLHGLTVWGLATLFLFLTIGSGVGGLIGGTANMISGGASMVGEALSKVAPQAADAVQDAMGQADFDLDLSEWREEARQLLRDTGVPEVQPDRLDEQAGDLEQDAQAAVSRVAQDPLRAVDREAMVNLVSERTGQSRQEAAQTVDNWEQGYQEV